VFFEIIVVGGDGALGQIADLSDGVGAAFGAFEHPMPKVRLQLSLCWGGVQTGPMLLRPLFFDLVNAAQMIRASNGGGIGVWFNVLVAAARE